MKKSFITSGSGCNVLRMQYKFVSFLFRKMGWSGGAMALGRLPVSGRPSNLRSSRTGPIALAVGTGRALKEVTSQTD